MPITKLSAVTDFDDQTIKNVTEIQLKTIVSDDDTSVSLGLGDDVGDNFIVDTDKLVVEGKVGGNVGIGTTSPESALHVETAASHCAVTIARNAKSTGEVGINLDGGTGGKIWYLVQQNDSDDLTLWDSNGDAARVTYKSGGKVGVGTTDPDSALHVETAASHCSITLERNTKDTGEVGLNLNGGTGGKLWYLNQQTDSDNLTFHDTDAARVTFEHGGNVGIGTASPSAKLEVSDDSAGPVLAKFRGSNDERLTVYQPSNGDWRLYPFRDTDSSYKAITIGNAVAGGLTVLGAGNVGINDTSPSYQLDVNGTARVVGAVTLDSTLGCGAVTSTGVVTGTGFTIGSAEINETELEILDGATLSTTELNYVDGVSSAIQTQLDGKSPTAGHSSIATVGTVGTGTWQGTVVASAYLDGDTAHLTTAQTFTGVKTFDAGLSFDSTPADETCSGITASFVADVDLSRGEVCYIKSDGEMAKAVATAAGTSRCVAMAAEDISADATGLFLLKGFLTDNGTFPAYTVGGILYTPEAETSGENVPEQTAPDTDGDFVQVVGWAVTANTVYFDPDSTVIEVA